MTATLGDYFATATLRSQVHKAYRNDPVSWAVDKLGIPRNSLIWSDNTGYDSHKWDGTRNPLDAIANALAQSEDVGVESGTGTGKSYFAAVLILWFLACWESRVFTFAPKEDQLRLFIWMEMGKLWPKFLSHFPDAVMTDLTIRMRGGLDDSWGAWGYAVGVRAGEEVATKAAGMHAEHMLIVTEETPGIPKAVMAAHENTCTAPHNLRLALGNPDSQQDALHQFCISPGVTWVRMSALDHPNIVTGDANTIPGAASTKSVDRRREKYGEASRMYQSRVRGISPTESVDALIRLAWCVEAKQAAMRLALLPNPRRALGVDVANSENGDQAAIARGLGAVCESVDAFACPNANKLGERVANEAKALRIDPEAIGVDGVGVGAGCVNEARRLDVWVRSLNGGERAVDTVEVEAFNNLRSQMWWQGRLDLERRAVALPDDDELIEDLITPTWQSQNGKIVVETKEQIKKRLPGGRSPNKGDAWIYWNWVRPRDIPLETPRDIDGDLEAMAYAERNSDTLEPWDNNRGGIDYGYTIQQD